MGKDKKAGKGKKGKADSAKEEVEEKDSKKGGKKGGQSVHARHILCEKYSKKEEALQKLKDGVKFDEVAKEFSEDKARNGQCEAIQGPNLRLIDLGGSLGWRTKGSLDEDFEKLVYDELDISTVSSPIYGEVKTEEGYHIVMVEGRK
ncbi:hypothetical protein B7494_g3371 [Chlorociboria aeruginascens]|nr:hypothetical protein B7494_g3371 [Chlorociboria aeruginascens]